MKKIDISTKKHPDTFTVVDDEDFAELNEYKWYAGRRPNGQFYAQRNVKIDGKWAVLQMHVAIMGTVTGKEIDHHNRITLDNQRSNLRHSTHAENMRNRKLNADNASGYKGVGWYKRTGKWRSCIKYNTKTIHLGYHTCLIKAAKAYDKAAKSKHGKYARLNFP